MLDRGETVRRIEQLGVVAVIRLRDPGKLRAVVDAIAAGGVRALEVTLGSGRPFSSFGPGVSAVRSRSDG